MLIVLSNFFKSEVSLRKTIFGTSLLLSIIIDKLDESVGSVKDLGLPKLRFYV